jgi:hypothetical protein
MPSLPNTIPEKVSEKVKPLYRNVAACDKNKNCIYPTICAINKNCIANYPTTVCAVTHFDIKYDTDKVKIFNGISGLILWIRMLGVLESKGKNVNYLWIRPRDFIDFYKIIKEEPDLTLKKKYKVIFWTQIALVPNFFIGGFILIGLTV